MSQHCVAHNISCPWRRVVTITFYITVGNFALISTGYFIYVYIITIRGRCPKLLSRQFKNKTWKSKQDYKNHANADQIDGCNRRRDAAYPKLPTRELSQGEGNYFFPFCRLFLRSLASQGVTDLWPVCGTENRLFLNARKMHSLPSERNRGNGEREERKRTDERILLHGNGGKEKEDTSGRGRRGRRKVVLSVVDILDNVYFGERRPRIPVKKTFCSPLKCFTNTVKSLLQGGVRYPS